MSIRWPTLALIIACYAVWGGALFLLPWGLALILLVPVIALQSSLQHEVLHGHPFANRALSEALVMGSLNLAIPYLRFRDTHLAHHRDATLTDPYDDPESNYLDPAVWARLPWAARAVLSINNTLLGRMLVGPLLGQITFMVADARQSHAPGVAMGWTVHLATLVPIVTLVMASPTPLWVYLIACYGALAVLKIRTFLEHQAHEKARGRTVIVEDRGPLAFLFLNNNFHVVHHMHPKAPWYRLPGLYAANRARYLQCNDGYRYASYGQIFRQHLLRAKDPVAHPLYPPP
ncbi:fatty acid desaturase [Rhodobacteraceae bacterium N5(2021)]|uniref:Fatty acid desaturase n=1 Tax=Gymnodinialimonas phycosphaerae TaxID=2841589 RepID=A0A975YHK2_9RHOB|nr:fatty acid desaturase [Gymnodinialimonas phycosphaerae]MBY4892930.1 fatty acid desaturase [Gymnodinialimonas phycosphaerae]